MKKKIHAGSAATRCGALAVVAAAAVLVTAARAQQPAPSYPPPSYPPPSYPPPAYPAPPPGQVGADPPVYAPPQDSAAPPYTPPASYPPPASPLPPTSAPLPSYPSSAPAQAYPSQPGGVMPPFVQPPPGYPPQAASGAPAAVPATGGAMRAFFATTLAAVAHATGSALAIGITQAVTGGITDWFARKTKAGQPGSPRGTFIAPGTQVYAPPAYPAPGTAATPVYSPAPAYPSSTGSGSPAYAPPPVSSPPAYPASSSGTVGSPSYAPPPVYAAPSAAPYPPPPTYSSPTFFDARTGSAVAPDPVFTTRDGSEPDLFAGLAFEIHAQIPGGGTMPVNPATHEFRTGDRFVVHYRPTLPGRMDIYNINPAGRQTRIDSVQVAAAQLATLGPYEFVATKGDDRLRLVLTPCSTPELLATSRDIVLADPALASGGGLGLAPCGQVTRSATALPATRDIRKVAVEDYTGFALDPVSTQERSTGKLAPREVTIVFRHR